MQLWNKKILLSKDKILVNNLRDLKGMGLFSVYKACAYFGVNPLIHVNDIQLGLKICLRWKKFLDSRSFSHFLYKRTFVKFPNQILLYYNLLRISRQIVKGSLRGFLHKNGLPVRGQRTHTNRYTQRLLAKGRLNAIYRLKVRHGV